MKIKYFGTSAAEGLPAFMCECPVCEKAKEKRGRNIRSRSQCLINDDFLIDYPPDTYMHVINYGLDLKKVRTVFVTHSHNDHFYVPDIDMNFFPFAYRKEYPIISYFGNPNVCSLLKDRVGDGVRANIRINEIQPFNEINTDAGYKVIPLKAAHDRSQQCLIYSIEKDGKRFLYGNDTGLFPEETMERIKGIRYDAISLDSNSGINKDGANHMGFVDIAEMRSRLIANGNADEKTIFIAQHFSHNCGCIYDEAVEILTPMGFITAYDGMELEI